MTGIAIQRLKPADCPVISRAFRAQGWDKPESQYRDYLRDQDEGRRVVLVAWVDGRFAGYLTVVFRSWYAAFRDAGIPEVMDLNVLKACRRQGVATALMDEAEQLMAAVSPVAGIGVGLLADYGDAQRLYVKRGYLPDGNGLFYNETPVGRGDQVVADDDLVLYMTKRLG